jgi:hypothetical protein
MKTLMSSPLRITLAALALAMSLAACAETYKVAPNTQRVNQRYERTDRHDRRG